MFIGDTILRFSKKSNPEDELPKELRFNWYASNNITYVIQLFTTNASNMEWEMYKDSVLYKNGIVTSNSFYIHNATLPIANYQFVVTGECSSIYFKFNAPRGLQMLTYNLDGITTIPAFSTWNATFNSEFPPIWTYSKYKNTEHAGAFTGCTYLTNYNDIPDTWK